MSDLLPKAIFKGAPNILFLEVTKGIMFQTEIPLLCVLWVLTQWSPFFCLRFERHKVNDALCESISVSYGVDRLPSLSSRPVHISLIDPLFTPSVVAGSETGSPVKIWATFVMDETKVKTPCLHPNVDLFRNDVRSSWLNDANTLKHCQKRKRILPWSFLKCLTIPCTARSFYKRRWLWWCFTD